MKLSHAGEQFIKQWESCRLNAYLDSGRVWTIGWGHTGAGVKMGTQWTQAKADATFYLDVASTENTLNTLVTVPLTQSQYDALVSLIYNIGIMAFNESTLLKLLNEKSYTGAASQIKRWDHVNGKVVEGLTNRRLAEYERFNKEPPLWTSPPSPPRQSLAQFLKSIFSGFFTSR